VPTATAEPGATPTQAPASVATATVTATATSAPRQAGEYDGVVFVVGDGSEITFTVREKLVELPLPNDAVLRTTALEGQVLMDGGSSTVTLDLYGLSSDQTFRDRYVRRAMFPGDRFATLTIGSVLPLPEGLAAGDEVEAEVPKTLELKGAVVPVMFNVLARDDGDEVFILARTTVTWEQLGLPVPAARAVTSVEDDIRVEVLLAARPR
jgi:hypothetical protein